MLKSQEHPSAIRRRNIPAVSKFYSPYMRYYSAYSSISDFRADTVLAPGTFGGRHLPLQYSVKKHAPQSHRTFEVHIKITFSFIDIISIISIFYRPCCLCRPCRSCRAAYHPCHSCRPYRLYRRIRCCPLLWCRCFRQLSEYMSPLLQYRRG